MRKEKRGKNHSVSLVRGLKLAQGKITELLRVNEKWRTKPIPHHKQNSYRTTSKLASGIMVWIQNKAWGFLSSFLPFSPSVHLSLAHPMGQHLSHGGYCPKAIWTQNKASSSHMTLVHLNLEGENFFHQISLRKGIVYVWGKTHIHSWLSEWDKKWYPGIPVYDWGPHEAKGEFFFLHATEEEGKMKQSGWWKIVLHNVTKVTECAT